MRYGKPRNSSIMMSLYCLQHHYAPQQKNPEMFFYYNIQVYILYLHYFVLNLTRLNNVYRQVILNYIYCTLQTVVLSYKTIDFLQKQSCNTRGIIELHTRKFKTFRGQRSCKSTEFSEQVENRGQFLYTTTIVNVRMPLKSP